MTEYRVRDQHGIVLWGGSDCDLAREAFLYWSTGHVNHRLSWRVQQPVLESRQTTREQWNQLSEDTPNGR